jgi:hypothetical protein
MEERERVNESDDCGFFYKPLFLPLIIINKLKLIYLAWLNLAA